MENAEEIFHYLEDFSKRKPKIIPQELNDYLAYVARTGDPVYQWSLVKHLFKEKLLNVITDFYETTPGIEIPPYPNVDPFNYDTMKNSLLERLDSFSSAPFTVQRICELLTYPRKQYNRVDKFMRAVEKNILVVSTREPGPQRHVEPENEDPPEPVVNGSDNYYNPNVEFQIMTWKENAEQQNTEPQPCSSDTHISVDDIEARLQAKQDTPMDVSEKTTTQYESVTPPELNVTDDSDKPGVEETQKSTTSIELKTDMEPTKTDTAEDKTDVEMRPLDPVKPLTIPEIKINDDTILYFSNSYMTDKSKELASEKETINEDKGEDTQSNIDDSSSDSNTKEEAEAKAISEISTSEESSSSSDNADGNSNSPKTDNETNIDVHEDTNSSTIQSDSNPEVDMKPTESIKESESTEDSVSPKTDIESDNYSISDVSSELPQPPENKEESKLEEKEEVSEENKEEGKVDIEVSDEKQS